MSQLIQHYQTSFVIQNDTQSWDNKLYQAQFLIGEWIKSHELGRFRKMKRDKRASFKIDSNFTHRASYASCHSWCKTDYCREEDSLAWAVQYTHRDSDIDDVFWVSDIGLRAFAETERLLVSVKICYKLHTEFALTGQRFEPKVSIPNCVEGLIETFKGSRFFSGDEDISEGIGKAITISTKEKAESVLSYIFSSNRKLAVVLLHGESPDVHKEANYLSKNLFAKALVYIVPYKVTINKVFARLKIEFNESLFIPPFFVHDQELRKKLRYFVTAKDVVEKRHQIILKSWLGVHPINERGAVPDIDNIKVLIRRRQFFKFQDIIKQSVPADRFEQLNAELKDMSGLFELSEAEKRQLESRVGELEERNLNLEIAKQDLEDAHATEVYNIKATHDALDRKSVDAAIQLPREYPDSFEALRRFAPFYRHLVFAEDAWNPAMKYHNFKDFNIAWGMLHDLDKLLWDVVFVKRGDIARAVNDNTIYEYASGEGKQTANDSRLAKMRKFEFEGKEYEMWAHLKYGNKPGKQLRIYFAIDHEKRRIIVGYIGEHMDNATTRTIH